MSRKTKLPIKTLLFCLLAVSGSGTIRADEYAHKDINVFLSVADSYLQDRYQLYCHVRRSTLTSLKTYVDPNKPLTINQRVNALTKSQTQTNLESMVFEWDRVADYFPVPIEASVASGGYIADWTCASGTGGIDHYTLMGTVDGYIYPRKYSANLDLKMTLH